MSKIMYIAGDATQPVTTPAIIAHICNNQGGWGAGFSGALSQRFTQPEMYYRQCFRDGHTDDLGDVQLVQVEADIYVANMIAQNGYSKPGQPAIDYVALEECLHELHAMASLRPGYAVHMPRIGTGLAGGKWEIIEPMIERALCSAGVGVFVYDRRHNLYTDKMPATRRFGEPRDHTGVTASHPADEPLNSTVLRQAIESLRNGMSNGVAQRFWGMDVSNGGKDRGFAAKVG